MSTKTNEDLFYQLQDWLNDHSLDFHDVHSDDRGYFVFMQNEVGNPQEAGSQSGFKRYYLPANFQDLLL